MLGRLGSNRVCKLGDDPGLIAFANFLRQAGPADCLPDVFGFAYGSTPPWAGLWFERLSSLSAKQAADWDAWIATWQAAKGRPPTDPFNVLWVLNNLRSWASTAGVGLDVLNTANLMSRPGTGAVVFTDPFY